MGYGFDHSPVPGTVDRAAGNNTQPKRIEVSHNVMQDFGEILAHVTGVGLRAGSNCTVSHNRIQRCPRYALQADSFYKNKDSSSLNSRFNVFEYNILTDTNKKTTDTGAIEMLGSGNPFDIPNAPWFTNNTIRFNNISATIGSSSSNGKSVCIHGKSSNINGNCRGMIWGIYLDGGQSGILIHGNIIGATLHGAVFDNVGGNNTVTNNILVGEPVTKVLMDFGAAGSENHYPNGTIPPQEIVGSTVKRNIFYATGYDLDFTMMMNSQVGWQNEELKINGSDYNLFWHNGYTAYEFSNVSLFPNYVNLTAWQARLNFSGPVTCSITQHNSLLLTKKKFQWYHNRTDKRIYSYGNETKGKYLLNVDCHGNIDNCKYGTSQTSICLNDTRTWVGPHPIPPIIDTQGWNFTNRSLHVVVNTFIVQVTSGKCMEVCYQSGEVRGCDGKEGSAIQLAACDPSSKWQRWSFDRISKTITLAETVGDKLYFGPPPRKPGIPFDLHSKIGDPRFVDPENGDFSLKPNSPAFELGFKPIPPIEAPVSRCGDGDISCLEHIFPISEFKKAL